MSDSNARKQIALSRLLIESARLIRDVMDGHSTSELLPKVNPEVRSGVHAISFYALRHYGRARGIATQLLAKKAPNALFESLLCISVSLLFADNLEEADEAPIYKEFVILNEAVRACSKMSKTSAYKGLLNACLRNFLRNKDALQANLSEFEIHSYPKWWYEKIHDSYPEKYESILRSDKISPPLTLRVNERKTAQTEYQAMLEGIGVESEVIGDAGLRVAGVGDIATLPGYSEGLFSVQDLGAQYAAFQIPLQKGNYVLDACAAPGGKTAHLLERFDLELLALDIDSDRLAKVQENLSRLDLMGPNVRLQKADASVSDWWDGRMFDAILADVPCTGSGVVRRHPDIKWLRKSEDISKTVQLQRKIIINLWKMLKSGGHLLYVTCSVFQEEGELQAAYFTSILDGAERLPALGHLLPPEQDGFFYALFKKN